MKKTTIVSVIVIIVVIIAGLFVYNNYKNKDSVENSDQAISIVKKAIGKGDNDKDPIVNWSVVSDADKKDGSTLDDKNKKVYLVRGQHKSYVKADPKAGSYDGADYYVYPDGHIVKRSE